MTLCLCNQGPTAKSWDWTKLSCEPATKDSRRLHDRLASFSMTSVASQTHLSPASLPWLPTLSHLGASRFTGLSVIYTSSPSFQDVAKTPPSPGEPSFPWPLLSLLLTSCFRGISHCPNVFCIDCCLTRQKTLEGRTWVHGPCNPKASQRTWQFKPGWSNEPLVWKIMAQATAFHLPETHWWRTSHLFWENNSKLGVEEKRLKEKKKNKNLCTLSFLKQPCICEIQLGGISFCTSSLDIAEASQETESD